MRYVPWATALIASTIAGVCVCRALIVRRRAIAMTLVTALLGTTTAGLAWAAMWAQGGRLDTMIAAVALSAASAAGGYALGAATIGSARRRAPQVPALEVGPPSPGTHVILLADEEPEDYDPAAVTAGLSRYDDGDIDLPPEIGRPLLYASERARYHRSGGSPARGTVRAVAASLQTRLNSEDGERRGATGDFRVTAAFCDGGPGLTEAVAEAVRTGVRTIVVAPLAAAWSLAFAEAKDAMPDARLRAAGVRIEFADPLWSSPHLSAMIAARVLSCLGGDRATDGIVLVSEGDPWEHAKAHGAYREQLTFLIQRVRAELIQARVAPGRIRRAWLWLEEPDIAEAVRHLAAIGARKVVVVPVTVPAETLATLNDLRFAAERAAADTEASVTVVPPWGDDPAVVEALTEAVAAALKCIDAS